jgi:hypothetical protein
MQFTVDGADTKQAVQQVGADQGEQVGACVRGVDHRLLAHSMPDLEARRSEQCLCESGGCDLAANMQDMLPRVRSHLLVETGSVMSLGRVMANADWLSKCCCGEFMCCTGMRVCCWCTHQPMVLLKNVCLMEGLCGLYLLHRPPADAVSP